VSWYYATITRARALESNIFETTWTTNAYLQLENWVIYAGIPGSKMDLLNGDRVYRVHSNHIIRLKLDGLGRRFIPFRLGDFYFYPTDPTLGQAKKHDMWLPIGP